MDEPVRLACPECDSVYRVKNYRPYKRYSCKNCGASLRPAGMAVPPATGTSVYVHADPMINHEGARALDYESGIDGTVAGNDSNGGMASHSPRRPTGNHPRFDAQLDRLDQLVDDLAAHGETGGGPDGRQDEILATVTKILELAEAMEAAGRDGREKLLAAFEAVEGRIPDWLDQSGARVLAGIEERWVLEAPEAGDGQSAAEPIQPPLPAPAIDVDALAERLVAGLGTRSTPLDGHSVAAVDALVRVADELVKEQSANSARLEQLAEEVRTSAAAVAKMDEWRGLVAVEIADEIGRTVEDRVVGPISGALAKQAPAILAELQDNKLVDIVSRSVREAQRPLLREIIAGGRGGVPAWLFASTLLPLLLILGYLFLPGDTLMAESTQAMSEAAQSLSRLEAQGMPLPADSDERSGPSKRWSSTCTVQPWPMSRTPPPWRRN